MSKYVEPVFLGEAFTCIFCHVLTTISWQELKAYRGPNRVWATTPFQLCICDHCSEQSLWENITPDEENYDGPQIGRLVLPASVTAEQAHPELPEECKRDFNEAREISGQSPRGAAALLRLSLQKLCAHLGGKGENINDDIKQLVGQGLAPQVQQALDLVRVTGNHAVHPGEISLEDSPEHVTVMFQMINLIVDELISRPRQISERFNALPIRDLAAIAKRDAPKA